MFNETEKKFLKLLNLDFVDSIDDRTFITSGNEKFTLCLNPVQAGFNPKPCVVYESNNKRIWLEVDEHVYRMVKVVVNKDDDTSVAYTIEENYFDDDTDEVVVSFYDRDNRRNCSIKFEPGNGSTRRYLFVTYIQNNKDFLNLGYITTSPSYLKGYDVGALQQPDGLSSTNVTANNFEKMLEKLITIKFCFDKEVKDYFLKLMPLYSTLFNRFKKVSNKKIQDMIDDLIEEREYINEKADEDIAEINAERQKQLKENAKEHARLVKSLIK